MSTEPLFSPKPHAWSLYQEGVCDAVGNGTGHIVVRARAGSGKTTTIMEAVRRLPSSKRVLLCAFNVSIAKELQARAPRHVEVRTLHSLGHAAINRLWPGVKVDKRRGRRLLETALGRRPNAALAGVLSMAKARLETNLPVLQAMVKVAGGVPGVRDDLAAQAVLGAMLAAGDHDGTVDFDDMVFVPVSSDLSVGSFDMVIVDETQDMNAAQLTLARKALAPHGRLVAVGDDRQAIYEWRGADVGFMERMVAELGAQVLPLSITYRCPSKVVALAQTIVPDIEAAPGAPAGTITTASVDTVKWSEGEAVLSRFNAPLVHHALAALRAGKRARIQGRDIGAGLRAWIESFGATLSSDLLRRAQFWVDEERRRLADDDENEEHLEQIADRLEIVRALAVGAHTVASIFGRIDVLFSDEGPGLVFSSVHRAKGLEWDRVHLLAWTFRPEREQAEENIWYVALSRTKRELVLVTDGSQIKSPLVSAAVDAARREAAA